jgi:hypothetical protein
MCRRAHRHGIVIRVGQRQRLHDEGQLHATARQYVRSGWNSVEATAQQSWAGRAAVTDNKACRAARRVRVHTTNTRLKRLRQWQQQGVR